MAENIIAKFGTFNPPQIGHKFGKWTVLSTRIYHPPSLVNRNPYIKCECECGFQRLNSIPALVSGGTHGCMKCGRDAIRKDYRRQDDPVYWVWLAMRNRCNNRNNHQYKDYGGRGILICREWDEFEVFRDWAYSHEYKKGLTIDRFPNNDGPYHPTNCRWATSSQQNRNQRKNVIITAFGESKTAVEWLEDPRCAPIGHQGLLTRINRGWPVEEAITEPIRRRKVQVITAFGETKTLREWARDPRCVVPFTALGQRIQHKVPPELAITSTESTYLLTGSIMSAAKRKK